MEKSLMAIFAGLSVIADVLATTPVVANNDVRVIRTDNYMNLNGAYSYYYLLSDGTEQSQSARYDYDYEADKDYLDVVGYYTWKTPNNLRHNVYYKSGVNGYTAKWSIIANPPALPASSLPPYTTMRIIPARTVASFLG